MQKTYYKHYPESQQVIIFIHGIMESPKQFRNLAKIAYKEKNSILLLLLPGHGKDLKNFEDTPFMEWVRYVSYAVYQMKKRYKFIILVGHSMGALFCLCEGAARKNKINQMIVIDTPLKVHIWPRVIKGTYAILCHQGSQTNPYIISEYHAMGVSINRRFALKYMDWLKHYMELFSIINYTRHQLQKVKVPILAIFAEKDEFVSLKSKKEFEKLKGNITILSLKESGHFCYHHSDLEILERIFKEKVKIND